MPEPTETALLQQLAQVNERSRTYGRQLWQVPFTFVAGTAVVMGALSDKPAFPAGLLASGAVGCFVTWHLVPLYSAARRSFDHIRNIEDQLSLPATATRWTPGHLITLIVMTAAVSLACLIEGALLLARRPPAQPQPYPSGGVSFVATILGLGLEILGILILAGGETRHHFAMLRYLADADSGADWQSEVERQPRWARPLFRIGVMFGSRNPEDMGQDEPLEATATKLAGYGLLFVGFIVQLVGFIASRSGR